MLKDREFYIDPIPMGEADKKKVSLALAKFGYSTDIRHNVLIVSYDQLRIHIKEVLKIKDIGKFCRRLFAKGGSNLFIQGLVICDEGHRLKNNKIKTSQAISQLETPRRIILSGTPIQNDLEEFYAMVSFVNPVVFGSENMFKTVYAEPILNMREPEASDEIQRIGRQRCQNLARLTAQFILRRTSNVNKKYLPPKGMHLKIYYCSRFFLTSKCSRSHCILWLDSSSKNDV